jgi:hypothetical protein
MSRGERSASFITSTWSITASKIRARGGVSARINGFGSSEPKRRRMAPSGRGTD